MAGQNSRDVNLVIRARNEADSAIQSATAALNGLFNTQEKVGASAAGAGSKLAEMTAALSTVDKAFSTINSAANSATSAFEAQQRKLIETKGAYLQVRVEADYAAEALARLQKQQNLIGPTQGGPVKLANDIKLVAAEYKRLASDANKLQTASATLENSLAKQQSAMQQIGSTAIAAGDAQARLRAEVELETQAINAQAAAAQKLTAIQSRINATTGVNRPATFDGVTASQSAGVLLQADTQFRAAETAKQAAALRDAAIAYNQFEQRARAGAQAMREVAAAEAAGDVAARKAKESAELRNAAIAYQLFEQRARAGAQAMREVAAAEAAADTAARKAKESAELRNAAIAYQLFEERARAGGRAMREAAEASKAEADALARLRSEISPLGAIQDNLNAKLKIFRDAAAAGKISALELANAEKVLAANAKRAGEALEHGGKSGKIGIFGLKPYEVQNLGYQVNDLVTQVASGTSLTQALAQQGGQILQLLPQIGTKLLAIATNPFAIAVVGGLTAIGLGLNEVADRAERLRTFNALLTASADGATYQAAELGKSVTALRQFGISAGDATAALTTFVRDGIAPDKLEAFARTAKNMSEVLGVEVPEAAKQLADAFSGGYASIVKLDEATNFLTVSEREHIKTLFEEGKAQDARSEAYNIFAQKQEDSAQKQRGPWAEAVRALGVAWSNFINVLANSAIVTGMARALAGLADGATILLNKLNGVESAFEVMNKIMLKRDAIATAKAIDPLGLDPVRQSGIRRLEEQLKTLEAQYKSLQATAAGGIGGDTIEADSAARLKTRQDRLDEIAERRRKDSEKSQRAADRLRDTGQAAYDVEIRRSGDTVIADAERAAAIAKERLTIEKEVAAAAKTAAADRERAINQYASRVVGAEGGTAQNPFSSAVGFGQFTGPTWKDQYAKVFGKDTGRSEKQILELRSNPTVSKAIIDNFARENARYLEKIGETVSAGNLYLAHFLGAAGAKRVLKADPNTSTETLFKNDPGVLSGNQGYFRKNRGKGAYRTAGELQTFIADRVGDKGAAQTAGQVAIANVIENSKQKQDDFNLSVEQGNRARQAAIDALAIENQLQDTALIAAQRKVAIDKAEADLRKQVENQNRDRKPGEDAVTLTDEQIAKTRELTAAQFDLAQAKNVAQAQTTEVKRPVDDLTTQRDALRAQIDLLRGEGQGAAADALVPQLDAVNERLREAIDNAITFYRALTPETDPLHRTQEQIDAMVLSLEGAKIKSAEWVTVLGVGGEQIARAFASTATNAIDKFAQSVAAGENVFKSLGSAFRQFASDFLRQIAQMIQQQLILNLVMGILRAVGSAAGGATGGAANGTGAIGGLQAHSGGIIGGAGPVSRAVSPAWFANAARYHTGGIAGLRANEVPAILEHGEEVLTRSDPRHQSNRGGGQGGRGGGTTVVNVFDPAQALEQALRSPAGEKVLINHVRDNPAAFRAAMG